jgi:polysaccharide export outer membrane protein
MTTPESTANLRLLREPLKRQPFLVRVKTMTTTWKFGAAKRSLAALSLLFCLSGCLIQPMKSDLAPPPRELTQEEMPISKLPPYRLQVGDVVDVKLLLNPELNDQVTVRPDGYISTTVSREVPAYGRTTSELQRDLEKRYSGQLVNPQVSVILRSFAPTRVYVLGEVTSPGEFITVGPSLTLLQAISRAGGVKNSAGLDKVLILRRGVSNSPVAYLASYNDAVSGRDPGGDVRLAPYDVVYVPRSGVGDVYLYFQQYVQQFVPASFGASYQLNDRSSIR